MMLTPVARITTEDSHVVRVDQTRTPYTNVS